MRPELRALTSSQGGVFLRGQALRCGYSKREIDHLLRRGAWVRIRWGAYAEHALVTTLDADDKYRLLVRAAMLRFADPALATHNSAAALHRLPLWGTDLSRVHVTRPERHAGRKRAGVTHHEASVATEDRLTVDGVSCTSVARTAVDVAREYGFGPGVVVADAALHGGADRDAMLHLAESMRDWPGSAQTLPVVRFADRGGESPGESLARIFLVEIGLPRPETQVVVRSGGFVARVDLLIPELRWVFEFDGRMKYRRTRDQCDPVVDDADVVWAQKQREDTLRDDLELHVSRMVWGDLFGSRRRRTAQRLLAKAERLRAPGRRRRGA
ncbi:MAG: type IV toxin-antitoxin system AbiEi family antitoxin domain-containing protein [Actinomycetota bacterium]|nr:type IV toxin-antitoxin system AbiEi family antitoxin domain-containing protein [Actinomycetota bacterium]